ncbi:MAG: nucleoside-diphosphate kinase [Candidatus Micrarchaeaceae archaeon]
MIEKTLVLIKPDGVYRTLIGKIISKFEDAGLKVVALKLVSPPKQQVEVHYAADEAWLKSVGAKAIASYKEKGIEVSQTDLEIGNKVREQLLEYLTGKPVVAMVIEGNNAVFIVRKIVGSTEPRTADPSSIRGAYTSDSYDLADMSGRAVKNIIHASGTIQEAQREISIWFSNDEIVEYKRADENIIY